MRPRFLSRGRPRRTSLAVAFAAVLALTGLSSTAQQAAAAATR